LPTELRHRLKITEGSILEAEACPEGVLLRPVSPLEGGKVVGEETHHKVIEELEQLRKKWR